MSYARLSLVTPVKFFGDQLPLNPVVHGQGSVYVLTAQWNVKPSSSQINVSNLSDKDIYETHAVMCSASASTLLIVVGALPLSNEMHYIYKCFLCNKHAPYTFTNRWWIFASATPFTCNNWIASCTSTSDQVSCKLTFYEQTVQW